MKYITNDLENWADIVFKDIIEDSTEYYWPKSNEHNIFEKAYMKFVNRNLNYFNVINMVVTALYEEPIYHPGFKNTLNFCKFVREKFNDSASPFGRMCIWYLPPGSFLLPHVDNFQYHNLITRYIFIVSSHSNSNALIKINHELVNFSKGTLFEFSPSKELHQFSNDSNLPFYFLGFDVWKKNKLEIYKNDNLKKLIDDHNRNNFYGAKGTNCKYISSH